MTAYGQGRVARGLLGCTMCLVVLCLTGADDTAAHGEAHSCAEGCRKVFQPVCGDDGRTYSSPCLATCQGVAVSQHGPCPGEQIFHPANKHVVTGAGDSRASSSSSSSASSPHSATADITPHHLTAFSHEGYRYTGQLTFASELAPRPSRHGAAAAAEPQQGSAAGGPAAAAAADGVEPPPLRALRITREGHVYVADLDESVELVLDALIEEHATAAAAADAASSSSPSSSSELSARPSATATATPSAARGILHSLRRWREYRPAGRGGRDAGSGGGKWKRNAALSDGGRTAGLAAPGEHVLQPVLESSGGAVTEASDVRRAATATATTTSQSTHDPKEREQRQPEGGERHRQARRSLGIFDTDDRVDCPRGPTYPFTAVGQINVHDSTGNYVCSGALVGPDVVLTAAHCVFNRAAQAFYDKLDFAPARYRGLDGYVVNPFGVVPWNYVTVYQSYSTAATPDPNVVDIAIIKLTERVGLQSGWMGVFEPCTAAAPTRYVALTAGYPSDQPPGSCKTTQCVVSQEPCTDGYLYHKCDTASGQSGSPMYMMAMTAARRMGPFVRAVHNIEWVQETPSGQSVSYINSAVSITPDHYRTILAWIAPSFKNSTSSTTPMGPAVPPPESVSG